MTELAENWAKEAGSERNLITKKVKAFFLFSFTDCVYGINGSLYAWFHNFSFVFDVWISLICFVSYLSFKIQVSRVTTLPSSSSSKSAFTWVFCGKIDGNKKTIYFSIVISQLVLKRVISNISFFLKSMASVCVLQRSELVIKRYFMASKTDTIYCKEIIKLKQGSTALVDFKMSLYVSN